MIDFIISKVAMAACALLVASTLALALDPARFVHEEGELERAASDICRLVDRAYGTGAESCISWRVPFLSGGGEIDLEVSSSGVQASSGDETACDAPRAMVHTWSWDGSGLNDSMVADLDLCSNGVGARSGEVIEVVTLRVAYDNDERLFVFVRGQA